MISSFCANPCVDRRMEVDSFRYGEINRIRSVSECGSGKGVNVALVAAELGIPSGCAGMLAIEGGEAVLSRLEQAGCRFEFVRYAGRVRTNLKIFDRSNGVTTEVNEPGAPAAHADIEKAVDLIIHIAGNSRYMVLTGSVPPGFSTDCYAQLTRRIHSEAPRCKVVLDAEGELFNRGLDAIPYLVKPNQYELELLLGRKLTSLNEIHTAAMSLIEKGIKLAVVSMGAKGAYITDGRQSFFAPPLPVPVRSTVGAGDSMIVGLLMGDRQGYDLAELFRCGMAAAAACVSHEGNGLVSREEYRNLLDQVRMERVVY